MVFMGNGGGGDQSWPTEYIAHARGKGRRL